MRKGYKNLLGLLAAAGLCHGPMLPAAAAAGPQSGTAKPGQDKDGEAARQKLGAALIAFDGEKALFDKAYAAEIVRTIEAAAGELGDLQPTQLFGIRVAKAFALLGLDRQAEAEAISEELIKSGDVDMASTGFVLLAASGLTAQAPLKFVTALERASLGSTSSAVRAALLDMLNNDMVGRANQMLFEMRDLPGRQRLAEALMQLGWTAFEDAPLLDNYKLLALRARMARGDEAGGRSLAQTIQTPRATIGILASKNYDGIFDAGLDRPGRIAAAVGAEDKRTAAALAARPDDLEAVLRRAQHLRSVGKGAEAFALIQPFIKDMAEVERQGRHAFWLVNEAAYALVDIGRADEAVRLMEPLIALDHDEHPHLVNMTINHGGMLNAAGRYAQSVALAERFADSAAEYASDYGQMFMWSSAACALAAQGKTAQAAAWAARMERAPGDNEAAMMEAFICLDRLDDAERVILKRLGGEDPTDTLIALQDYQVRTKSGVTAFDQLAEQRWAAVTGRPAVKAAFDKVGRRMTLPLGRSYWGMF